MKRVWVAAERESEVREAARAWRRAGAISDATLSAIETRYSAAWPSASPVWSGLGFVLVSIGVVALFAFVASVSHSVSAAAILLAAGLPLVTERLRASPSAAAARLR